MKSTGIVRKMDELGRVVLPKELRDRFGIADKDPVEIFVDGDRIILQKYMPGCAMCGENPGVLSLHQRTGKMICKLCIEDMGGK